MRARLRLLAVVLLGLLTAIPLILAVKLYFFPDGSAVAGGLVGVLFGLSALAYGLARSAVVRQSRGGQIAAVVWCVIGAVLQISVTMAWPEWTLLGLNVVAAGVLVGCVPERASA